MSRDVGGGLIAWLHQQNQREIGVQWLSSPSRPTRRNLGLTLVTIGAVVGTNATIRTLLTRIFAIVTVVAAFRERGPAPIEA